VILDPAHDSLEVMPCLLQQVRFLDPVTETDRAADVLINHGTVEIVDSIPADVEIRRGEGLILAPGLVDLYSHSGEPGFEDRETLTSLLESAIAGGFTRLNILPDTDPAIDNPTTVAWLKKHAAAQINCWGALTHEVKGQQMTELIELADAGIVGFADGKPITNFALIRRVLEYLQPMQKPIALWACDPAIAGSGVVREGVNSMRFGLPGIPAIAETAPLAALLECVAEIGTPIHLMRISTARSVELIRAAKSRGVPVTASTTWLNLLLNTSALASYDPCLRLEAPLGNTKDQEALIAAVQEGVIDAIAVDHSPYTYEEKTVSFGEAPPGAIGLELALPLLWGSLVESGRWSALDLWKSLSLRPAQCLGQSVTDWVLFDPAQSWTCDRATLKSHSTNTIWLGKAIAGRVIQVYSSAQD
jgi:dihydroorotase